MYDYNTNIDFDKVSVEALDDGLGAFHRSLDLVLERVAPFTSVTGGPALDERIRRLCTAVNVTLDILEELTGMANPTRLPVLIERMAELAVTGTNVEVQIGVAGDLRVDKNGRLTVDELLTSCARVPLSMRGVALREGVNALQRLLALLLLRGWADELAGHEEERQQARRAIVEAVQGGRIESGKWKMENGR